MYVPDINKNLISVSTITYQDLKVELLKSHCVVNDMQDHYKIIATRIRVGGLHNLDVKRKNHQALASTTMTIEGLWHQRYCHLNYHDLLLLQNKGMVEGIPVLKNEHSTCVGYAIGKMHRE
jgi:hypothetical protein